MVVSRHYFPLLFTGDALSTDLKSIAGRRTALALLMGLPAIGLAAEPLCARPTGRAVLLIRAGAAQPVACDMAALDRLPQATIETRLPDSLGLAGHNRWSGVRLSHIAQALGAPEGAEIQLTALNNYAVSVPLSDLTRFDPVLATRRNGTPIGVRDKGPLILIYPFDQYRELQSREYVTRSIWQVHEIRAK